MSRFRFLIFLVTVVIGFCFCEAHNVTTDRCPSGKFGDGCRFKCHCQLSTSCDRDQGTCYYGCESPWMGPGCQIASKLTGRPTQSSTFSESKRECPRMSCYYQSELRTVTTIYDANSAMGDTKCSRMNGNERPLWWKLDLSGDYIVTGLELKIDGFLEFADIYVGPSDVILSARNKICSSLAPGTHNVTCRPAIRGRFVTVVFYEVPSNLHYAELCAIKVRGYRYQEYCPGGRFGPGCLEQCSCMIDNERCHHVDGSCPSGCKSTHIGYGCHTEFQLMSRLVVSPQGQDVTIAIPEFTHNIDSQRGPVDILYILEIFNQAWREVEKDAVSRYVVISGLEPYTDYQARVILARRTVGDIVVRGPPGPETNFTSPCGAPTSAPMIKMVETDIANLPHYPSRINATVIWKPVPLSDANCHSIDHYKLEYRRGVLSNWTSVRDVSLDEGRGETVRQTTVTRLLPNVVYEFRISAVNQPDLATAGDVVAVDTPSGVLGRVQNLTSNSSSSWCSLSWLPPDTSDGILTGYRVRYSQIEIMDCSKIHNPEQILLAAETNITLSDLQPYRKYNVSVCAVSAAGCGESVVMKVDTEGHAPTNAPSRVAVTGILSRSVRVQFVHLPCHLRYGNFRHFKLQLQAVGGAAEITATSQHTVLDIDNLTPNTEYSLTYVWVNYYGQSPKSEPTVFRTLVDVPGPPVIFDHVTTPRTIALLWKRPLVTNGDVILNYEVMCSLPGVQRLVANTITDDVRGTDDVILHQFNGRIIPGRLYRCKVRASTSAGAGVWSKTHNIRTVYHCKLAIRNFTVTTGSDNSTFNFNWSEPLITSGILGYKLSCLNPAVNSSQAESQPAPEPVLNKNFFVGRTNFTWKPADEDYTSLKCSLATYTYSGAGQTVSVTWTENDGDHSGANEQKLVNRLDE